jgi:hypothetical protein
VGDLMKFRKFGFVRDVPVAETEEREELPNQAQKINEPHLEYPPHSTENKAPLIKSNVTTDEINFISRVRTHYSDRNHHQITDADIIRFLVGQKCHHENALEKIGKNLEWKISYSIRNIHEEDFSVLSKSAKLYFSGGFDLVLL